MRAYRQAAFAGHGEMLCGIAGEKGDYGKNNREEGTDVREGQHAEPAVDAGFYDYYFGKRGIVDRKFHCRICFGTSGTGLYRFYLPVCIVHGDVQFAKGGGAYFGGTFCG